MTDNDIDGVTYEELMSKSGLLNLIEARKGWNGDMTRLKTYLISGDKYTAASTIERAKKAAKILSKAQLAKVEIVVVAELRAKRLQETSL